MVEMIVKIQRFIENGSLLLIYNQDRTLSQLIECEDLADQFKPGERRVYAFAKYDSGTLTIMNEAPKQDW